MSFWKAMELAKARKIRRGKDALYDLWLHNLWAPAVMPRALYTKHAKVQINVRKDADGISKSPYRAPVCNKVIRITFLHTTTMGGLGPSFSLYVWSNTSSTVSARRAGALISMSGIMITNCCCCCGWVRIQRTWKLELKVQPPLKQEYPNAQELRCVTAAVEGDA